MPTTTETAPLPISHRLQKALEAGEFGQRFVITFATKGIRNGWIEVVAYGFRAEQIAMAWANAEYGRWSSIYTAEQFAESAHLFSLGCIGEEVVSYSDPRHIRPWCPPWAELKPEYQR